MAITERDRRDLFNTLENALGSGPADKLMELLPNEPADQLVTRTDMHAFGGELRGEMAELRGEMAELRGEMAELRAELRSDMAELRTELRGEMLDLRVHLQRLVVAGMGANAVAVVTALMT